MPSSFPCSPSNPRSASKNDREFQVYLQRRERLKERYETKTVSLSLDARIAEAEAEKELDDIQSGAFLDKEDEDDTNDIVLDETLNILSDMINLKNHPESAPVLTLSESPIVE